MRSRLGACAPALAGAVVAAAAAVGAGGGCGIGQGQGEVTGPLMVVRCYGEEADGTPKNLDHVSSGREPFQLRPTFFVGEPVDSPDIAHYPNFLLIRVQNKGVRPEVGNILGVHLVDLYEVGRCVSGRTDPATGAPDWDTDLCDRSDGVGRLRVGVESEVARAFLWLNDTCQVVVRGFLYPTAGSGDALGLCNESFCPPPELCPGRGSWLTFAQLGGIAADSTASVPKNFKVNFGQRINVSALHLELCGSSTVTAVRERLSPVPEPTMLGTLDGWFDFDLERGQAAQPFP